MNQYLKLNFQGVNAICSVNITSNTWASLSSTQDLGEFSTTPERKKQQKFMNVFSLKQSQFLSITLPKIQNVFK